MKLLFSGDPHGRMSTLDTFKQYLAYMLEIQDKEKPDFVLIAGDLFHDHATIRSEVMNQWLKYLNETKVHHILMKGNHDESSPGSKIHALEAFEALSQHKVVGNESYLLPDIGKFSFVAIPYIHDVKDFIKEVDRVKKVLSIGCIDIENTILFIHQTIDGVNYDKGMYAPDGFPAEIVSGFRCVVSGHIHKEQRFGNIWYPGTPYALGFVDSNEHKSLWMIDADTLDAQRIPTPMPQYFTASMEAGDLIRYFDDRNDRENRRHHYKITLRDSKVAIRALKDSKEFKKIRKLFKVVLCTEYVDAVRADRISESASPEKMLEKYVYEIMNTKLDRTELYNAAMEIMRGE